MKLPKSVLEQARNESIEWAMNILDEQMLILDTETTGLGTQDEIIELGLIDCNGDIIFKSQFLPTIDINPNAEKVHGLNKHLLRHSDKFTSYISVLNKILFHYPNIIIYNAKFDTRLIQQTCELYGVMNPLKDSIVHCAMYHYTKYLGNWNEEELRFKASKLPGATHGTIDDCQAVLQIIHTMKGR